MEFVCRNKCNFTMKFIYIKSWSSRKEKRCLSEKAVLKSTCSLIPDAYMVGPRGAKMQSFRRNIMIIKNIVQVLSSRKVHAYNILNSGG